MSRTAFYYSVFLSIALSFQTEAVGDLTLLEIGFDEPGWSEALGTPAASAGSKRQRGTTRVGVDLWQDDTLQMWTDANFATRQNADGSPSKADIYLQFAPLNPSLANAANFDESFSYNSVSGGRISLISEIADSDAFRTAQGLPTGFRYGQEMHITFAPHVNVLARNGADETSLSINSLYTGTDAWEASYVRFNDAAAPSGGWSDGGFTGAPGGGSWFVPNYHRNSYEVPAGQSPSTGHPGNYFQGNVGGDAWAGDTTYQTIYASGSHSQSVSNNSSDFATSHGLRNQGTGNNAPSTSLDYSMSAGLTSDATIDRISWGHIQEWNELIGSSGDFQTTQSGSTASLRQLNLVVQAVPEPAAIGMQATAAMIAVAARWLVRRKSAIAAS